MPAAARAPEVAAALKLPFAEQIAFFRGKLGNLVPTAKWDDLMHAEHDVGFMVAGAAKADLLADLAEAVDKAIADGETIQQFRRRFLDIIQRHGWAGFTGDDRKSPDDKGGRGLAWRTRVIYETNLLTSYAAGRRAQLEDGGYTHWMYKHSDFVQRPRPHHVALNGIVRPKDDPFWQTHYPPNGWGCRCRVLGVRGPAQARRLGGDWDKPLPSWAGQIDPKTGAPVGVDKGFGYMPGGSVVERVRALTPKLDRLPAAPSVALIQEWLKTEAFAAWYAAPSGSWPLARLPDADAQALGARDGVRVAQMSEQTAAKQRAVHPEITPQEYAQAQRVIDGATAKAIQDNVDAQGRKTGTQSLVYVIEEASAETGGHVLVVKATRSGDALWITSFRRLSRDAAARDAEVSRVLRGERRK